VPESFYLSLKSNSGDIALDPRTEFEDSTWIQGKMMEMLRIRVREVAKGISVAVWADSLSEWDRYTSIHLHAQ
jgi:hypothetical protein